MINKNLTIEKTFSLAIQNHQENKFHVAVNLYRRVLEVNPNYAPAHNNLGVLFQQTGEHQKAKDCFEKALDIDPNYIEANNSLADIYSMVGKYLKAKSYYEKTIEINPNHPHAHNNLGATFNKLGEYQKAKDCFEKAIEISPNHPQAYNSLGVVFQELGKSQEAKTCYEKAIQINPNHFHAHNNLGTLFLLSKNYKKAEVCYEKALELDSSSFIVQENISRIYIQQLEDFEKATSSSYKALKMYHDKSTFVNQSVPLFRLKHDVQQAKYLSSKNYKIDGLDQFQKIGNEILSRKENKEDKNNYNKKILLTPDEVGALLPYRKSDHVYKPKKISGSCINPNKNWQDVEDEYFNSSNQIMFIDDFLSEEALIELREFCLVSKVWNKEYEEKYLGAFSANGFVSPIHLQIAKDLQVKLPKLFGPHKLGKLWGFKYDATLGKGINIHADFALHNLNFWITPDEYNNNKNSGGLKVYDAPAPDNWTYRDYNMNTDKIYKFLKDNNAKCTNVPYKFNRAVLFNSAYFHETDEIDFKDEYEGRRINNTYLFGDRSLIINK